MTTIEIQIEEKNKILKGLEKAYEKLLEFKKTKNSELVVLRNNKIVKIKPEK
jgi:hypothetical protein